MCKVSKVFFVVGALLVLSLAAAQTVQATLISVEMQDSSASSHDYNANEPLAAAANSAFDDSTNVTWNQLEVSPYPAYTTSFSALALKDRTGAATSVDLSVNASGTTGWTANNGGTDVLHGDNWSTYNSSDTFDWSLAGLGASTEHVLYFYGGGYAGTAPIGLLVDTDGDGSLADETAITVQTDAAQPIQSGLVTAVSSASGGIIGRISTIGAEACWSGFQIAEGEVPEPAAIVMMATGLIGLLAYAWRKRR